MSALEHPIAVFSVIESNLKLTHVIEDPTERVLVLMQRKPVRIGGLAYLLAVRLLQYDILFILVGVVHHAERNSTTPLEFLQAIVLKLRRTFASHGGCAPNVDVDSSFRAASLEMFEVRLLDNTNLLKVTASVRNGNDTVAKVRSADLIDDEYRTYAQYIPGADSLERITEFDHYHNRSSHTVTILTNAAKLESQELTAILGAFDRCTSADSSSNLEEMSFAKTVLHKSKFQYARSLRDGIQALPKDRSVRLWPQ